MNSSDEPGKLFVGGLSWETTQDSLQQYFSRFGEVVDSVVMKNSETGRSRGFGFVTFKDPDCLTLVLTSGPHELDGRTIDPKSCNPRGATKVSTKKPGGGAGGSFKQKRDNNFPKVFLGGLPSVCTETDLRNFFSKYGKVVEVVIMYDQERKKSRGFGFLSFENDEPIDRVCAEHYVTINGKQVECKRAEPREASRSRGGNAGGGGGGGYQGGGPMPNNQWGAGPNMMAGPTGWGTGPMGGAPGAPPGGPAGGPMPNGMMAGYQGGWGAPQQQQQGAYQGYGTNYQGWGTAPSGYTGYGGTGTQYPQQQGYGGYGFGGYGGFSATPAVAGGQQPPGVQGAADPYNQAAAGPPGMPGAAATQPQPNTATMGNYAQESSNYGPARGNYGAGGGGGDMGGTSNNPYGASNQGSGPGVSQGYGAGGYNQTAAGGAATGGQTGRPSAAGYHPYRR